MREHNKLLSILTEFGKEFLKDNVIDEKRL